MKAKEYYAKYSDGLKDQSKTQESGKHIVDAFLAETVGICQKRNIKLDRGLQAVLKEQNNKWNVLAKMFNPPILKNDGFIDFINQEIFSKKDLKQ